MTDEQKQHLKDLAADRLVKGLVHLFTSWAPLFAIVLALSKMGACTPFWDVQSETAAQKSHKVLRAETAEGDAKVRAEVQNTLGEQINGMRGDVQNLTKRIDQLMQQRGRR